jgi:hypothetical protein
VEKDPLLVRSAGRDRRPWNRGLLIGQKKPLEPKHVWSIRVRLEIARSWLAADLVRLGQRADPSITDRTAALRHGTGRRTWL